MALNYDSELIQSVRFIGDESHAAGKMSEVCRIVEKIKREINEFDSDLTVNRVVRLDERTFVKVNIDTGGLVQTEITADFLSEPEPVVFQKQPPGPLKKGVDRILSKWPCMPLPLPDWFKNKGAMFSELMYIDYKSIDKAVGVNNPDSPITLLDWRNENDFTLNDGNNTPEFGTSQGYWYPGTSEKKIWYLGQEWNNYQWDGGSYLRFSNTTPHTWHNNVDNMVDFYAGRCSSVYTVIGQTILAGHGVWDAFGNQPSGVNNDHTKNAICITGGTADREKQRRFNFETLEHELSGDQLNPVDQPNCLIYDGPVYFHTSDPPFPNLPLDNAPESVNTLTGLHDAGPAHPRGPVIRYVIIWKNAQMELVYVHEGAFSVPDKVPYECAPAWGFFNPVMNDSGRWLIPAFCSAPTQGGNNAAYGSPYGMTRNGFTAEWHVNLQKVSDISGMAWWMYVDKKDGELTGDIRTNNPDGASFISF